MLDSSRPGCEETTDFMKTFLQSCVVGLIIVASHGMAASAATLDVQVADAAGKPLQDAAVYAVPLQSPAVAGTRDAEIEQKSRKFMPVMSVVQTGTRISFPNNDTVRHHVYSFSPTKPFELKLYSGTPGTPILFDKPGTVIIGCNIHDQMVAYIQVVDTPHYGKSDQSGKVRIAGLAPGKYKLKAWHYRLAANAVATETEITIAKTDMATDMVVGVNPASSL